MEKIVKGGFAISRYLPHHGTPVARVLFSHANGVAADTYSSFLQKWADSQKYEINAYDMRGMGSSPMETSPAYADGKDGIWNVLSSDTERVFEVLQSLDRVPAASWIFAGHSIGAWLSLRSAPLCHVQRILLFDMPLLSAKTSFLWTLAVLAGRRDVHHLAKTARRRKPHYPSRLLAQKSFQKSAFFKGWSTDMINAYIDANYREVESVWHLRHTPMWEADIFETMPANAASVF